MHRTNIVNMTVTEFRHMRKAYFILLRAGIAEEMALDILVAGWMRQRDEREARLREMEERRNR
jgi:hypothetical protein